MDSIPNLPNELWNPVLGFEGHYMASNLGRVKSLDRTKEYRQSNNLKITRRFFKGQILKPYFAGVRKERLNVDLACGEGIDGETGDAARERYQLSRLVWESFNGEIPAGYWVYHQNRDWKDCTLTNLVLLPLQEVLKKRNITNFGKYQRHGTNRQTAPLR